MKRAHAPSQSQLAGIDEGVAGRKPVVGKSKVLAGDLASPDVLQSVFTIEDNTRRFLQRILCQSVTEISLPECGDAVAR